MQCVECHAETPTAPCTNCGAEPRPGGRYTLRERVGASSTGMVFRGHDIRTGDPVVVQEVWLGGRDPQECLQIARREASLLRLLHHPGLPRWRDEVVSGVGRSAALYLVQDFIDAPSLQDKRRTHRFTEPEVLQRMVEVLRTLDYMHHCVPPIVHRAIEPANLLTPEEGPLTLVDFGAVRDALQRDAEGGHTLTGTFGYLAPEQRAGQAVPATDLYALGMTALVLLTDKDPRQLHDRAGRLDWSRVEGLSPSTTRLLEALLQPDPADRPPTAAVVLHHIQKMLDADHDARADAEISPTLVPAPMPFYDDTTGVQADLLDEPTGVQAEPPPAPEAPPPTPVLGRWLDAARTSLRSLWGGDTSRHADRDTHPGTKAAG